MKLSEAQQLLKEYKFIENRTIIHNSGSPKIYITNVIIAPTTLNMKSDDYKMYIDESTITDEEVNYNLYFLQIDNEFLSFIGRLKDIKEYYGFENTHLEQFQIRQQNYFATCNAYGAANTMLSTQSGFMPVNAFSALQAAMVQMNKAYSEMIEFVSYIEKENIPLDRILVSRIR